MTAVRKVIRISWNDLPDPVRNNSGELVSRTFGTSGDDDVIISLPFATCPPEKRWWITEGVKVAHFAAGGDDRITTAIGNALKASIYSGNAIDGIGIKSVGGRKDGGYDLIQGQAGQSYTESKGPGDIDMHGVGANYKDNPATITLHTKEDRIFVPSDEGADVDSFRFWKIRDDGMAKLQWVDATFHSANPILDGFELRIIPTQRASAEPANNVWIDVGNGSRAEQRAAVEEWLDWGMSDNNSDQWIFS